MRRHRTAVLIDHDIRVAVIRGKKQLAAFCQDLIDDLIKKRFKDLGLDYDTYYSDDIWWKPISMG